MIKNKIEQKVECKTCILRVDTILLNCVFLWGTIRIASGSYGALTPSFLPVDLIPKGLLSCQGLKQNHESKLIQAFRHLPLPTKLNPFHPPSCFTMPLYFKCSQPHSSRVLQKISNFPTSAYVAPFPTNCKLLEARN